MHLEKSPGLNGISTSQVLDTVPDEYEPVILQAAFLTVQVSHFISIIYQYSSPYWNDFVTLFHKARRHLLAILHSRNNHKTYTLWAAVLRKQNL